MSNIQKKAVLFTFVFLQIAIAVIAGFQALHFVTKGKITPYSFIGNIDVGKLSRQDALKKVEEYYGKIINKDSLIIKYKDGQEFKIRYDEIGTKVDYGATVNLAYGQGRGMTYLNLINGYFISQKRTNHPVVLFNNEKLAEKLRELSAFINKEPVNANIFLKDDKIIKVKEVNGLRLNVEKAAKKIRSEVSTRFSSPVEFKLADDGEIETVYPGITSNDLEGADEVISRFSTDIASPDIEDSIRLAVSAINKVLIYPVDLKTGEDAGIFSFNKYLSTENGTMEQNNEGYNQVVSTLYAAVLSAGINRDAITRTSHKTPVDYIEPGLDAIVFGNTVDFKFKNTLDNTMVIFAEVKGGKVIISLAGKKKDKLIENSIKVEIGQKFTPPLIKLENRDLEPGEEKLVSQGKEGLKVNVFRVKSKNNEEVGRELISSDKYDAVETVIQTGPAEKVENNINK